MKKVILAIIVIILITASGTLTSRMYYRSSTNLTKMLRNVSEHINSNNWEDAEKEIEEIEKLWGKIEKSWTVLIDHFEIDNIEMSLKKAKKYIEAKNVPLSLGELEGLNFMLEHIATKEKFSLENIF